MNRPAALEPQNRWLLCATAGLGLCLASTEYERYTALWVFGTRTPEELAFIMLALAAALALGVAVAAGSKARLSSKGWLLAVLALVQTAGLVVRAQQAFGEGASSELATASSVCLQAAGLLFVLYAEFFLEVGVRKAIRSFALALAVAGALQIACAMAPSGLALGAAFFFMPGACALLALGDRLRGTPETSSEQEDITAEREQSEGFSQAFPFWECCASIALINVLLLSLHDQAMALQDSGQASRAIQVSAGIASVASGALFFSLLNHLQEMEFVELFRTLVLPLVVVALYVSALFDDSVPALYLVPLGICYSVLLLFVWTVPRYYRPERMPFAYTCIASSPTSWGGLWASAASCWLLPLSAPTCEPSSSFWRSSRCSCSRLCTSCVCGACGRTMCSGCGSRPICRRAQRPSSPTPAPAWRRAMG